MEAILSVSVIALELLVPAVAAAAGEPLVTPATQETQARRQIQLPSTLCQWSAVVHILLPSLLAAKSTSHGAHNE